jgi:hypothetical protein
LSPPFRWYPELVSFGEFAVAGRQLLLGAAIAHLAGCADLLGVVPLSGTDASADVTPEGGAGADSGSALDAGPTPEAGGGCAISWVDASSGAVPAGAVPNPVPGSTVEIYVCRASSATLGTVPGKLLPGYACYYGDGQQTEIAASDYAVFVPQQCTLAWKPSPSGVDPVGAVVTGALLDGGLLYSCRVSTTGPDPGELGHEGWSTDHECVYSLSGQSLRATDFDVLTAQ